ncbi:hypothetical protein MD484_g6014, partial [Candolleomyces efflorescens]
MEGRSTRSRVTLSDDILQVPQESPLKKARSVRRSKLNANKPSSSTQSTGDDDELEDDDELLLSPQKMDQPLTRTKRSVSPPPIDEYSNANSAEEGRELKRLKRDQSLDADEVRPRKPPSAQRTTSHTRNFSDSNALPPKRRKPAKPRSKKPNSTGSRPSPAQELSPSPDSGRAKSVPLLFSTTLPQIDLRHPPPSPTRARARSLSKEPTPKLRICPLPMVTSSLESIPDESSARMDVDSNHNATQDDSAPSAEEPTVDNRPITSTDQPTGPAVEEPARNVKFSEEINVSVIETPAVTANPTDFNFSPLTPLPDTPHPSKLGEKAKVTDEVEDEQIDLDVPIQALKIPPSTTKDTSRPAPVPKPSLLPRPSMSNLAAGIRLEQKPKTGIPNSGRQQPNGKRIVVAGSQKKGNNAFERMMSKPDNPTVQAKGKEAQGKAKRVGQLPRSIFEQSSSKPVNRVKSAMKPKGRSTAPAPAPALVPVPLDEEDDFAAESARDDAVVTDEPPVDLTPHQEDTADEQTLPPPDTIDEPPFPRDGGRDAVTGPGDNRHSKSPELPHEASGTATDEPKQQPTADVPTLTASPDTVKESASDQSSDGVETVKAIKAGATEAENQVVLPTSAEPDDGSRSKRQSKLPRLPSAVPATGRAPGRTTRSTSTKKGKAAECPPEPTKATKKPSKPLKRTVSGTAKTEPTVADVEQIGVEPTQQTSKDEKELAIETLPLPPGSPMKLSSPVRHSPRIAASKSSPVKTPHATPSRIPVKPAANSSPSPTKLVRSASMYTRPVSENRFNSGGSTLSTLSSALEKLRMPAPSRSRPSTSMGFNRDIDDDSDMASGSRVQDDSNVGKKSSSTELTDRGGAGALGRSTTLGSNHFLSKGKAPAAGGLKQQLKQSTLFFPKTGVPGRAKPFLGGFSKAPKASRNPGLPTVIGSPVKGGRAPAPMDEDDGEEVEAFKAGGEEMENPLFSPTESNGTEDKGKGKGRAKDEFSSRRASVVSHLLSQSLQSMQSESSNGKGLMGPPPVPANISARSSGSINSPGSVGDGTTPPGRRSTRIAAVAATQAMTTAHSSKKAADADKPVVNEALKFLKDCIIYVDVKTEAGEEAEQRKKVDETDYLIDLDEVSLLTNPNKRRRSMLPKMISHQVSDVSMTSEHGKDESNDGDVSMDSQSSSVLDDLPPLERARRRKSMLPVS